LFALRNDLLRCEQMSWRVAQEECTQKGMQMATLKTQSQMESVAQALKTRRLGEKN
jgi:hypothetical protein